MPALQKANLGVAPNGAGGDDQRTANMRFNANVDVLSAILALGYNILSDNWTLAPSNVGTRFGLNMGAGGKVVKLPLASSVSVNACVHFFNVGPPVTIGFQGNDGSQVNLLNTGDWATYIADGGTYWHVAERGKMLPDEVVSGFLTVAKGLTVGGDLVVKGSVAGDLIASGKLSGVNSPNLLINGSGELGNTGWNGTNFTATPGNFGEGSLFLNAGAINTGTWVVDASNDIPCGPGVPLALSAEFYSMGLNAGRVYVKCEAFKADGTFIGTVTGTPGITTKLGYTFRSAAGVTPDGTAAVRVSKVADAAPNISAFGVAFRRIKLERNNGATLYSQEATIAYLGGAPTFSGVPYFGRFVPWHSGNLIAPMTLDGEQTVSGIKRFTAATSFSANTYYAKQVTINASAPDGLWSNAPLVIAGYPGVGSIGIGSNNGAINLRCSANSGTLDVVSSTSAAFAPVSASAFNVNSDVAIKAEVETIENAMEKLKRLRGVTYVMKSDETRARQLGVIAQEVAKEFPEAVTETSMQIDESGVMVTEGGRPMLAVNYSALIGPLLQAFIELEARVSALEG
ncbi:tail fiber domain-containing protein [Burkholderia cepacia]|uniref:tail fiber domain-containing protein n=1 Tax=Burkholderia cepacia TaxID=292 RepID=UPI002FE21BEA